MNAERGGRGVGKDSGAPKKKVDLKKLWPTIWLLVKPRLWLISLGLFLVAIKTVSGLTLPFLSKFLLVKDVAGHLQGVEINRLDLFARPPVAPPTRTESEEALAGALALGDLGVFDLLGAFQRMLRRQEQRRHAADDAGTVIFEESYTVADKIERLRSLVAQARGQRLGFTELFRPTASRVEMVVTFLALLELVRLQQLRVEQAEISGDILISAREVDAAAPPTGPALP